MDDSIMTKGRKREMMKKIAVITAIAAAVAAVTAAVLAYYLRARRTREYYSFDFPADGE